MNNKIIGYKLVPVYENKEINAPIVQPAIMNCCLTGENLSANNGAGMFFSPTVVDKIRTGKIKLVDEDDLEL